MAGRACEGDGVVSGGRAGRGDERGAHRDDGPGAGGTGAGLGQEEELWVGQEVGTLWYLVHDAVTAAGTTLLSFNAQQLRSIAASRKKT